MVNGMTALALVFIPAMCRIAETATAQVRSLDFIEAARATGAGTFTIVRYHVLGNVLGPVFIYASSLVSVSILLASGLSFADAANLANHAGGIVVMKRGTASVTADELLASLESEPDNLSHATRS